MTHAGERVFAATQASATEINHEGHDQQEWEGEHQEEEKCLHGINISTLLSTAKIIEMDVFLADAEIVEHVDDGFGHRRWPAHIVVDIFGGGMILEILVKENEVDKAGRPLPAILG